MSNLPQAPRTAWYIEVFLAIGGWVSGLLAAIAIFALAAAIVAGSGSDGDVTAAMIALVTGGGFVWVGASVGKNRLNEFARHFAIAAIAAGLTAATAGAWYLVFKLFDSAAMGTDKFNAGSAGLFAATALAAAGFYIIRINRDGILTFLTTLAVYGVYLAALTVLLEGSWRIDHLIASLSVLAGCVWFLRSKASGPTAPASAALMIAPMLHFMILSAALSLITDPAPQGAAIATGAALVAAILYCLGALRTRYKLTPLIAAGAILIAGVWLLPHAGAVAIVILCTGVAANHRGLAVVGVLALTWFVSRYYYDLSATLLEKSAILSAMGAATLMGVFVLRRFNRAPDRAPATAQMAKTDRRGLLATLAFAGVLVAAYGIINHSVWRLETAFRNARTIYLPLGPRDPRSLIQGDYMVLNFRGEIYPPREEIDGLSKTGQVYLTLDENSVAAFSRIAGRGDHPETDEIRINYIKEASGRMRYCPTSFFFQEGDAPAYQGARFAVVLVADDGGTLLVDLADENRRVLKPGA